MRLKPLNGNKQLFKDQVSFCTENFTNKIISGIPPGPGNFNFVWPTVLSLSFRCIWAYVQFSHTRSLSPRSLSLYLFAGLLSSCFGFSLRLILAIYSQRPLAAPPTADITAIIFSPAVILLPVSFPPAKRKTPNGFSLRDFPWSNRVTYATKGNAIFGLFKLQPCQLNRFHSLKLH